MPTLPLFTTNNEPDASHRVVAPGGYESWHFDVESAAGDIRLIATFGEGNPSDPDYTRRYLRYRRRPTRWPPPVPAQYPWAHVAVYERDSVLGRFTTLLPPEQFAASTRRPEVKAGVNAFVGEADGTLTLELRGMPVVRTTRNWRDDGGAELSARLAFRPLLPHLPQELPLSSARVEREKHFWVVADPQCEVSGVISVAGGGEGVGANGREIDMRGRGYHDHRYGTGPLGAAFNRLFTGRAFLGNVTYAFRVAQPFGGGFPNSVDLLRFDADRVTHVQDDLVAVDWHAGAGPTTSYPMRLAWGTGLRLTDPRVIDRSPSSVRLIYQARADGDPDVATALCEVSAAPKTGWGISRKWFGPRRGMTRGGNPRP